MPDSLYLLLSYTSHSQAFYTSSFTASSPILAYCKQSKLGCGTRLAGWRCRRLGKFLARKPLVCWSATDSYKKVKQESCKLFSWFMQGSARIFTRSSQGPSKYLTASCKHVVRLNHARRQLAGAISGRPPQGQDVTVTKKPLVCVGWY